MFKGVVTNASSNDFNGKKLWSFQIQGVRAYFRTGEINPNLVKGDYVEFEAEGPDQRGNYRADVNSFSKKAGNSQVEAKGPSGFRKAFNSQPSRDFPTKAERAETQSRIEIQSCRNSALELIKVLLSQDAIKFGAKADKVAIIEELLEHYTAEFLERNNGKNTVGASSSGEPETSSLSDEEQDIL